MPTETYLARERARRCVLCEQGHRRGIYENCQQHWVLVASAHCHKWKPCTAPPDAALYEELAKERDELRADFDWLLADVHQWNPAGLQVTAEDIRANRLASIRDTQEKEKR